MQVIIGTPRYIKGTYSNIPISGKWNQSLAEALKRTASEIELCPKDIQDIDIDRSDSFIESIHALGSVGYSVLSEEPTDTYILNFEVKATVNDAYDYSQNIRATGALLDALSKYLSEAPDYSLAKCILDVSEDLEGFTLKACFIKNAQHLE